MEAGVAPFWTQGQWNFTSRRWSCPQTPKSSACLLLSSLLSQEYHRNSWLRSHYEILRTVSFMICWDLCVNLFNPSKTPFRGVRGSKMLNNTPKATIDVAELGLGPTTIQPQHLNSQSQSQINLTGGSHSSPNLKIVIALNSTKLVLRVGKRPL